MYFFEFEAGFWMKKILFNYYPHPNTSDITIIFPKLRKIYY